MKFKILDLFCGAGGMSYGMHKNPNFKTVVALDIDEKLAITLKKNMPEVELVIGDIRDEKIKGNRIETRSAPKIEEFSRLKISYGSCLIIQGQNIYI